MLVVNGLMLVKIVNDINSNPWKSYLCSVHLKLLYLIKPAQSGANDGHDLYNHNTITVSEDLSYTVHVVLSFLSHGVVALCLVIGILDRRVSGNT